jgi:Mitochondrial carrier protein
MPYSALQYSAFEFYNRNLALYVFSDPDSKSPVKRFVAGSLAGITSVTFTYPVDLARTRLAVEVHATRGLLGTLTRIYRNGGVRGLYRGAYPTLVGVLPYSGISFLAFGLLKRQCTERGWSDTHPVVVNMAAGGTAGLTAQCATYPLDMVRRRLQALHSPAKMTGSERLFLRVSKSGSSKRVIKFSIWRSIVYIVRKEGGSLRWRASLARAGLRSPRRPPLPSH